MFAFPGKTRLDIASVDWSDRDRSYAPRGPHDTVVRIDLPCSPCNRIRRPPERCVGHTPDCLSGIEVARVLGKRRADAVEVAAGDVGGQVLAAGLIDEVRMDVVPVVFGSGKRYFGSVHAQHLLEDPDVVIQGNRVLHLRYRVRR